MTLREILKEHKGEKVKIGSQMSFFYCGKVHNLTYKEIRKWDTYYVENYKRFLERHQHLVEKFKTTTPKNKKQEKELKEKVLHHTRTINNITKKLNNYTPLLSREVKRTYPSISRDELGATIIRIKGNEIGKFWTCKEYKEYKESEKGLWLVRD